MALAKIVGFDVMPRTPRSTQRASSPDVIHPRLRLSSQGLWPKSSCRRCSFVIGSILLVQFVEQFAGAVGDVGPDVPEVLQCYLARRRRAEAVDRHRVVGPAIPPERR